jgi:hypothetical protein
LKLGEYLPKVIVNCIGADEKFGGDFAIGVSERGKLSNVAFLRSQFFGMADGSAPRVFASGSKFEPCALREAISTHGRKLLICQPELGTGVDPPLLTSEPFSVEKSSMCEISHDRSASQLLERPLEERFRIRVVGKESF